MWPPPDRRREALRWRSDRKVVYIFREKGYNRKKVRIQEGRKGAECMCSQNELNILLKEIAAIYRKVFGDDIVKIVLYGSYARGTFDAESDIDIVAIVKGEREELQRKLREVWVLSSDLELEYETILSPTVIPYEEFEKYRNDIPYYRNIEKEGIRIVA